MTFYKIYFSKLLLIIKNKSSLFRLWYLLYRKHKGVEIEWFSENTKIFIDGFPRSGNTFIQMLMGSVFPDLKYVHHFHSVGAVKVATNLGMKIFIIYRNPLDSITSNYLKEIAMTNNEKYLYRYNNKLLLKASLT